MRSAEGHPKTARPLEGPGRRPNIDDLPPAKPARTEPDAPLAVRGATRDTHDGHLDEMLHGAAGFTEQPQAITSSHQPCRRPVTLSAQPATETVTGVGSA